MGKILLIALMLLITASSVLATVNTTGGTASVDGAYTVHSFSSNSTFGLNETVYNATILIVGGGGAGGSINGGGGGGGGVYILYGINITANTTVIVGAGGIGVVGNTPMINNSGQNSSFGSYIAIGGGHGANGYDLIGYNGGSGGGAGISGSTNALGGNGTSGQGWPGGKNDITVKYTAGGGGGCGGGGGNGTATAGGTGAVGCEIYISGSAQWYGAGGGGAYYTSGGTSGQGGGDCGGDAATGSTAGGNGTAGFGCGGGGAQTGKGGGGGRGVVIVRYETANPGGAPAGPTYARISVQNPQAILYNGTSGLNLSLNYTISTSETLDKCYLNPVFNDVAGNFMCYQEFANVSTGCGGVGNGTYTQSTDPNWDAGHTGLAALDGIWTTYATGTGVDSMVFTNYTIPPNTVAAILEYRIGGSDSFSRNISIPPGCMQNSRIRIVQRVYTGYAAVGCINSTDTYMLNTNTTNRIYEEAIWWNISSNSTGLVAGTNLNCQNSSITHYTFGNYTASVWFNTTSGLFNSSNVSYAVNFPPEPIYSYSVAQVSPADALLNNSLTLVLSCSVEHDVTSTLGNVSFILFNTTSSTIKVATGNSSGTYNTTLYLKNNTDYNWSCRVEMVTPSSSTNSTGNRSFGTRNLLPSVAIQQPVSNQINFSTTLPRNIATSYTASSPYGLSACWGAGDYGVNTTFPACANFSATVNLYGRHNITVWANDTYNNIAGANRNFRVGNLTTNISIGYNQAAVPVRISYNFGAGVSANCTLVSNSSNFVCPWLNGTNPLDVGCTATTTPSENVSVYPSCKDSLGDSWNGTASTFILDTVAPSITIQQPLNGNSTLTDTLPFSKALNFIVSHITPVDKCWYTKDGGASTPLAACGNTTMSIATAGNHTVIVYSNDTAGNIGQMSSNFTADMIISNLSGLGPAVNQPFSINLSSLNVGGGQTVTCTIGTNKTCYLEILGSCVTPTMVCSRAYTSTNAIINCSSLAGDSAMALWVSCNSSTQSWNSTPQNIFMDTDAPLFSVANFQGQNENFYARNLTGNWTILDSNLYRVNVTIDNTVAVFAQNEINQSSYSYNLTRTTTDLTPGLHTLKIQAWDSHTAKQIGSYDVSKPILSNAISFDTGTNNIEVVALDISGNVLNPWSTTKLQDRYTFSYKPEQTQSSYTFKVTTDQPIHIIERPDSIWKLWLVSGNNWIDFYTPESPGLVVGMVRVDDYTVEVTVALPEVIAEPIGKGGVVIEPAKDTIPLEDDKLNFYSIGDLNTASQNYTFYSYSITSTYNSQVAETENQTLSLLVQFTNNSQPNYNVSFSWNGTAYPITMVQNDTQRLFTVNFITPQIDGVTFSPTSYWTYNISNESNTITVTQQVVQIAIDNCSLYNYTALQVKFYDESSPTTGLVADLHLAITYWFNDPSVSKTFNMNFQGSNTYQVCMANSSYNYRTNLYAQYNTTGGYTHRYYLYNQSINGSIQLNLTMYNFQSQTGVSLLELTERDYLSNVYKQNIVTKLLRYYPGEGVWRTVQMDQSDIFGLTMFHILEQSTDYRLLFYDTNNTFIKQSDTVRFACTDAVCLNTILLQAPTTATTGDNLNLSWSYNSATGVISVPWNDLSGATDTVIMTVTKQTYTGPLTICNVTQIGSAGLMTCNTTGYTGAVFLNIETHSTVTKWVQHWIELAKTSLATTIGPGEGAFWTALIVITCVGFGLISPVIAIITAIIGLVAVYFLGIFSALTVPFIILAALLGIFIGYRVRN